eukprot:364180-Chlamydomonas_euryale.AAC.12
MKHATTKQASLKKSCAISYQPSPVKMTCTVSSGFGTSLDDQCYNCQPVNSHDTRSNPPMISGLGADGAAARQPMGCCVAFGSCRGVGAP